VSPSDRSPDDDRLTLVVGRVGRAHGVHGDVSVEVRTDEPLRRFATGVQLGVQWPAEQRRSTASESVSDVLSVAAHRWHSGRLLVHFDGVEDRGSAEALRGALITVQVDRDDAPSDPDEYYDHQLVGLVVVDRDDQVIGEVGDVVHGAQDLLVVRRPDGGESLVPFVQALVPEVDLEQRRIVTELPDGLLDLGSDAPR
jgi:16S rRNA processing protein RimM